MLDTVERMMEFLEWCTASGVRVVKFTEGGPCRPLEVMFFPRPAFDDYTSAAPEGPVADRPDGPEEGELLPTEEELFAASG